MNNLINLAKHIPTPEATLTVAYTPIRLSMPGRQPLELRVTAPGHGDTYRSCCCRMATVHPTIFRLRTATLPLSSSGRKEGSSSSSRRMRVRGSAACRQMDRRAFLLA